MVQKGILKECLTKSNLLSHSSNEQLMCFEQEAVNNCSENETFDWDH